MDLSRGGTVEGCEDGPARQENSDAVGEGRRLDGVRGECR